MRQRYQKILKLSYILTKPFSSMLLHNSHRSRILVKSKNEVLLVRSSFGHQKWSLPGGGIHKGEDPREGAKRELHEETGILVTSEKLRELATLNLPRDQRWPRVEKTFFLVEFEKKPPFEIIRPQEMLEIAWRDIASLPKDRSMTVDEALKLLASL